MDQAEKRQPPLTEILLLLETTMDGPHWQRLGSSIVVVAVVATTLASLLIGFTRREQGANVPPPARSPLAIALLAFVIFALYGSWVPFQFQSLGWKEAAAALKRVPELTASNAGGSDWVANILLFVPIGFFALGAINVRSPAWANLAAFTAVIFACALASVGLEMTQLWFPPRTPSQGDILAQTIGASGGALLWLLGGESFAAWTRAFAVSRRPKEQFDWLLECYALGLILFSVFPLDLTLSLTQIAAKYRGGKIELFPFGSGLNFTVLGIYQLFKDIIFFVPIGMLTATWRTLPERPVRSLGVATLIGLIFAAAIEFVQLLVVSRFTSTADILLGTLGVGLGAWLMDRWKGTHQAVPLPLSYRRGALWLGLATIYAGLLMLAACLPTGAWITDREEIKRRYLLLFEMPLTGLYWGDPFHALGQVTQKLLFFAPLGVLCCLAAYAFSMRRALRRLVLACLLVASAGVAIAMEVCQIFIKDSYPTLTDAALRMTGAAIAMSITARLLRDPPKAS